MPRQAFKSDHCKHLFAELRAKAADRLPSVADITDQDLRDTAVTWLARAGCTVPEISAITGHSAQSATKVQRHYLASHPELADNAIRKMVPWFDGQEAQG
jgi:integrase